ncbi:unnamed protein product [Kuraishia capsulata CBS 1993]|uniref:RNB domain-containing protein n=1 Tax=Kuraishia capsulata CBS 1993 TaxID=1382522 RepID=W6MS46_9ASCO|nr:uncharacterized protein KUCA_T00005211001 [Kuraishia capsulata CBS 1993]CDK29223.1 unnamed protein product [Kuraishia capsulata CBS 1993]
MLGGLCRATFFDSRPWCLWPRNLRGRLITIPSRAAHSDGFFKANKVKQATSDEKTAVEALIRRPGILNLQSYYEEVLERAPANRARFRGFSIMNKNCKRSFEQLDQLSVCEPVLGSFVEARNSAGEVVCGIVTSVAFGRFQKDLDSIEIITPDAGFELIRPSTISFHIYALFSSDEIAKRVEQADPRGFRLLKQGIVEFIDQTQSLVKETNPIAVYSAPLVSNKNRMISPKLGEVARFLDQMYIDKTFSPYKHYFGAHLMMNNNPHLWKVSSKPMFLAPGEFSDRLTLYQSLPLTLMKSIGKARSLNSEKLQRFRDSLQSALTMDKESPEYIEMVNRLGSDYFGHMIDLLRYYVAYPHPNLEDDVTSIVGVKMSPTMIQQMLRSSGFFSRMDKTPLSDLYLRDQNSLVFTPELSSAEIDYFKHVRAFLRAENALTSCKDLKVIGFKSRKMEKLDLPSHTDLAISVEDLGMNKWKLNVHVPDVASFYSPRSDRLSHIKWGYLKDFETYDGDSFFFSKQIVRDMSFKEGGPPKECMTLSVIFDPESSTPWIQPDVEIRPDVIESLTIVDANDLQSAYEKTSRISKLFAHSSQSEETLMKLRMIMESHRRHRQDQGWLNVNMSEILSSKDEYLDKVFEDHKEQLGLLTGELAAFFAHKEAVPLLHSSQEKVSIVEQDGETDGIQIRSGTPFVPSYTATSYDHFLLDGGFSGPISITSYVAALRLLNVPEFGLMDTKKPLKPLISLGLHYGYSEFAKPMRSYESLLNQYQLLKIAHRSYMSQHHEFKHNYLYYTGHLSDAPSKLPGIADLGQGQWAVSFSRRQAANYITRESRRFHVLQGLEGQLDLKFAAEAQRILPQTPADSLDLTFFKCFILESESYPKLAKGYCVNLGIEVEILLSPGPEVVIGDRLICSEIIYLNAIENRIVLR